MTQNTFLAQALDDRKRDNSAKVRQKNGTTLNKNLAHPIAAFAPQATLTKMRQVTGEISVEAIRKASHGKTFH